MNTEERIRDLESEVEHWRRLATDPSVMLVPSDGGVDMRVRHALVVHMAEAFADLLGDAPNYVSMSMVSPQHGRIVVTVRRGSGKTPEDLAGEYRERLEAMGVTDLAPLPEPPREHCPNPIQYPQIVINAVEQRFECRGCGGSAPCPQETTGTMWHALCRAFEDLHRGCKEKSAQGVARAEETP